MRVRYETSIATLVQFIAGVALTFFSNVISIIGDCRSNGTSDCVSNALVSLMLVILITAAYGFLLGLGYLAQDKRSSRLALLLIGLEGFASLIFLFDARHAPGIIDKLTNLISLVIAIWVVFVAFNLYRAKGARIVKARSQSNR